MSRKSFRELVESEAFADEVEALLEARNTMGMSPEQRKSLADRLGRNRNQLMKLNSKWSSLNPSDKTTNTGLAASQLANPRYGASRLKTLSNKIDNNGLLLYKETKASKAVPVIAPKELNTQFYNDLQQAIKKASDGYFEEAGDFLKMGKSHKYLNALEVEFDGRETRLSSEVTRVMLSKLNKTSDFGGGGGVGSGNFTNEGEVGVALYLRALFTGRAEVDGNDIALGKEQAKECFYEVSSDLKFDTLWNGLAAQPDWGLSCRISAKTIWEEQFNKVKDSNLNCHHRGPFIDVLKKAYDACNRVDKVFFNFNKWNPGDIFVVRDNKAGEMIKRITEEVIRAKNPSWKKLNALMVEFGGSAINPSSKNKPAAVGISLKKLAGSRATISTHNDNATRDKIKFNPTPNDGQAVTTGGSSFFSSKDVAMNYIREKTDVVTGSKTSSSYEIKWRTQPSTWSGEISGDNARHGRVGYAPLANIINRVTKEPGYLHPFKKNSSSADADSAIKDMFNAGYPSEDYHKIVRNLYKMATEYSEWVDIIRDKTAFERGYVTFEEELREVEKKDVVWFYSKYMGMLLVKRLYQMDSEQARKVMELTTLYAASETVQSSPFIKIQ